MAPSARVRLWTETRCAGASWEDSARLRYRGFEPAWLRHVAAQLALSLDEGQPRSSAWPPAPRRSPGAALGRPCGSWKKWQARSGEEK